MNAVTTQPQAQAEAAPSQDGASASNIIVFQDEELKKRAAGLIAFWTLSGDVRLEALDQALRAEGSSAIRPDAPSNVVALRRAVETLADNLKLESHGKEGGKWRLVAPGSKEEVKEETTPGTTLFNGETRRKKALVYDVKLTAQLTGNARDVLEVENLTGNPTAESDLRAAMAYAKTALDTSDISAWLCERLSGLGAVRLRESGGFYFVPVDSVSRWEKLTNALKACSSHLLYSIPAMKTKDAMEAILAAVTAETRQACKEISEAVGSAELGSRALETKEKQTSSILSKVERYEGILGTRLDDLRQALDETRQAIATAILLASQPSGEAT